MYFIIYRESTETDLEKHSKGKFIWFFIQRYSGSNLEHDLRFLQLFFSHPLPGIFRKKCLVCVTAFLSNKQASKQTQLELYEFNWLGMAQGLLAT